MFCPECGTKIDVGMAFCGNCGLSLKDYEGTPPLSSTKTDAAIVEPENDKSLTVTEQSNNLAVNNFNDGSHKKFKSNIVKPIAFISVALIAVTIIGIIAHFNSDDYKVEKATELIVAGNYSEGINVISDIYTPQATAIKNFVNVEYALTAFIDSAESDDFEEYKGAYYDFVNEMDLFKQENEIFYLPENLYKNYERYNAALDFSYTYVDGELYSTLCDAQMVMLNMVDVKTSTESNMFTAETLQDRIETSEKALAVLSKYDFSYIEIDDSNIASLCCTSELSTDSDHKTVVYLHESLPGTINAMISLCKSEIESSNEFVETILTKWEIDDELYWKNPETGYYSYVGSDLNKIYSENDIHTNTNKLTHMIQLDIFYYLLVGTASPSH